MQNFFDDLQDECPWYYFDGSYKVLLGSCLFVFGVFGVLLNGWLFATFIHSHLLIFRSHILVLNLCTASLGRNLIGFPFAGSSAIAKRFYYMGKAVRLERIFYKGEIQREQKRLTQSLHTLCVTTLALWIPAGILVGYQWLPLLVYGYRTHVPPALAVIAPIASEAATSLPVLCFIAGDERLRAALLGRMRKHYALLRPERAKRYNRS
ncbi:unnamed protein product [Arctia plantaginis]|uniref:G protein-coupled receptor n=1 Tax=Arctia plantaginis TaxID=874455 RepID=A0A8S0ZC22_ARCPL|nr:unnamed protein product [Arctia plantaginis]